MLPDGNGSRDGDVAGGVPNGSSAGGSSVNAQGIGEGHGNLAAEVEAAQAEVMDTF